MAEQKQSGELTRRGRMGSVDPFEDWMTPFWPFRDLASRWLGRSAFEGGRDIRAWSPQVETLQKGDQFVVRVDLPGLKREDVTVDVGDDRLIIQGERRYEHEEEREGLYRSERSYGSFFRSVPIPEGALPDTAAATFRDGVLEITMTAPPREVSRGRRLEIGEARSEPQGEPARKQKEAGTSRS